MIAMLATPLLALHLLATPIAYQSCPAGNVSPVVDVSVDLQEPNLSNEQPSAALTLQSAGAYKPPGTGGPRWHTQGLTSPSIRVERSYEGRTLKAGDGSFACAYINTVHVKMTVSFSVWVANEFPPGSCMFNAVREHEMKHVETEKNVANSQINAIRAAVESMSQGRGVVGPVSPAQLDTLVQQFQDQLSQTMEVQMQNYKVAESLAQQQVDTAQEYLRVSQACPGENHAPPVNGGPVVRNAASVMPALAARVIQPYSPPQQIYAPSPGFAPATAYAPSPIFAPTPAPASSALPGQSASFPAVMGTDIGPAVPGVSR